MPMLNDYCSVDRDPRGVVTLAISNAGSLNILSSPVIDGVRAGLEEFAADRQIRVLVLKGGSDKSLPSPADGPWPRRPRPKAALPVTAMHRSGSPSGDLLND